MSNPLPLALLFGPWTTFLDANGAPLAAGTLTFTVAGSSTTPQLVYSDSSGNTSLGSVVTLDSSGRPSSGSNPTGVYILPTGYRIKLADASAVTVVTQDHVEDVGSAFLSTLGNQLAIGSKSQASGYTVTNTDNFVSVNGGTVNLQAAIDRGQVLFVQNLGSGTLTVTPNGADTINGLASLTLPAAASPIFPTVMLLSDGVSNYLAFGGSWA